MARISIYLNIRKALLEKIDLTWGGRAFLQDMDYEGIPFKCHKCHKHGHKAINCELMMSQKE